MLLANHQPSNGEEVPSTRFALAHRVYHCEVEGVTLVGLNRDGLQFGRIQRVRLRIGHRPSTRTGEFSEVDLVDLTCDSMLRHIPESIRRAYSRRRDRPGCPVGPPRW